MGCIRRLVEAFCCCKCSPIEKYVSICVLKRQFELLLTEIVILRSAKGHLLRSPRVRLDVIVIRRISLIRLLVSILGNIVILILFLISGSTLIRRVIFVFFNIISILICGLLHE
jgi:hypothetical protein